MAFVKLTLVIFGLFYASALGAFMSFNAICSIFPAAPTPCPRSWA